MTTNWDSSPSSTALIVLAFMNHGYTIPNNASDPMGIYPKYMVRRGLNYIFQQLESFAASGNNLQGGVQCDGLPDETAGAPHNCTLYRETENFGYSTSIVIAPLAGSNALNRVVTEGLAGNGTNGRTIGDILKRLVNGLGVGQADGPGVGRGGWQYGFNANTSDGSTIGWNMLALLDAEASGVDVPNYIAAEFVGFAYEHHKNTDGSFDYTANNDPATNGGVGGNLARAAVGLQAAFLAGDFRAIPMSRPRPTTSTRAGTACRRRGLHRHMRRRARTWGAATRCSTCSRASGSRASPRYPPRLVRLAREPFPQVIGTPSTWTIW